LIGVEEREFCAIKSLIKEAIKLREKMICKPFQPRKISAPKSRGQYFNFKVFK
jgi:uncharacterized protein YaaQ